VLASYMDFARFRRATKSSIIINPFENDVLI